VSQVEYGELAQYYELINEQAVDYDAHTGFLRGVLAGLGPRPTLLDIACGPGLHARRLQATGARVVGVDLSLPLLRIAHGRRAAAALLRADMRALPCGPGFDGAYCLLHSMNYLTDDRDLTAALRSALLSLRPAGLYVVDFLDYGPPGEWQDRWTETYRGDGVVIRAEHDQRVGDGGRVAIDHHRYTVRDAKGTWEACGQDRLRVTTSAEMRWRVAGVGFQVLATRASYPGDRRPGSGEGIIVARRPGAR